MGIILHAAYRKQANPTISVPAPVDAATPKADWWYDVIAKQCKILAGLGVTAILLPPVLKTSAGSYPGADGYGPYDDYDIGSKNQFFSRETRFGNREQLQRLCAVAAANGIDIYADFVPHQRSGGNYGEYRYLGADGKTFNGRFPKHKGCFRGDTKLGYVNQDPVMDPPDDFSFGDELCPINSNPKDYVAKGLIDAGDWLIRTLGLEGGRIDDTKGQAASFVKRWATSKAMKGKYWFGEYADGNPDTLYWAVHNSGCDGVISTADFGFHYRIKDMCEGAGRWNMQQLTNIGYCAKDPIKALTFVENQDSDTNGFGQIAFNKAAAYFAMLTLQGYPSIYYRDWSKDRDCYGWGMQEHINNYMWINANLISGDLIQRYADYNLSVYERQGGPKCLCAINNDPYNGWRDVWVQTGFGPNVQLHDYTGHSDDVWTNQDGWAHIWIPPNVNGLGTVAYSRAGLSKDIKPRGRSITQTFFGAVDLDIGPALSGTEKIVGSIWCAEGTDITIKCDILNTNNDSATISVLDADNNVVGRLDTNGKIRIKKTGWTIISILWLDVSNTSKAATFELTATYTASKTI